MGAEAAPALPTAGEVEDFNDRVEEVARLIGGLQAGTLPPEYIDSREEERSQAVQRKQAAEKAAKAAAEAPPDPKRQAELRQKVEDLKANRQRKEKARQLFQQRLADVPAGHGTDYTKWDLFMPSDEEDDLINSCHPNTPEFAAMEKDIDDRHKRMVEQRQVAERQRVRGNELYKQGRYSEAYQCYEIGLDAQRHSMVLHANAAMASIKQGCYVQTIEHCDKVLHLAEFLHNRPTDPLCVKALQRRAAARKALRHYKEGAADLDRALQLDPGNAEVRQQAKQAQQDLLEHNRERDIAKQLAEGEAGGTQQDASLAALRQLETLVCRIREAGAQPDSQAGKENEGPKGLGNGLGRPADAPKPPPRQTPAAACQQLETLLREHEGCAIYLRECRGLQALAELLRHSAAGQGQASLAAAALNALAAACLNSHNLQQMASLGVLRLAAQQLSSADASARSAAVALLYLCSTDAAARKAASCELCSTAGDGRTRPALAALLDLLPQALSSLQVTALSLLGNCMVDRVTKDTLCTLDGGAGAAPAIKVIADLLRSQQPLVVGKAASLLGNLCGDDTLRTKAANTKGCVAAMFDALLHTNTAVKLAASGALCNLLKAPEACELARQLDGAIPCMLAGLGHPQAAMRARAAGLLARLAPHPGAYQALQAHGAVDALVAVLAASLQPAEQPAEALASPAATPAAAAAPEDTLALQNAVVRVLATLAAKEPDAARQLGNGVGLDVLAKVVTEGYASDEAVGNAALCIGDLAKVPALLTRLGGAQLEAPLIEIARSRSGAAQRNAGIALSRLAQHPACLTRIRDLHGLEVIYQNVRP